MESIPGLLKSLIIGAYKGETPRIIVEVKHLVMTNSHRGVTRRTLEGKNNIYLFTIESAGPQFINSPSNKRYYYFQL